MKKYHENGKSTPWVSDNPTVKELNNFTIGELIMIAKHKRGVKKILIDFLTKTDQSS